MHVSLLKYQIEKSLGTANRLLERNKVNVICKLLYCFNCETLPPLGTLPSLESLVIEQMHSMKKVGAEFLGWMAETDESTPTFPKLKVLEFRNSLF